MRDNVVLCNAWDVNYLMRRRRMRIAFKLIQRMINRPARPSVPTPNPFIHVAAPVNTAGLALGLDAMSPVGCEAVAFGASSAGVAADAATDVVTDCPQDVGYP